MKQPVQDGIVKREAKQIKVATLITAGLLSMAVVALGFIAYWALTGADVLQFKKDPIPVNPRFLKSEEKITLNIDFCKFTDTAGRVTRRLVSDKTEIFAPTVIDYQPAGCYNYSIEVPIPPQTAPGTYHINYRIVYNTNLLHVVTEEVNSEDFEIVE